MKTSKEVHEKIRSLKLEITQINSHYHDEMETLRKTKEYIGSTPLNTNLLTQKLIDKQKQKLKETEEELAKLEKERDEKVDKIRKEIDSLRSEYRKNYDKYREEDEKARKEKINNIKKFLHRSKPIFIGLAIFNGLAILFSLVYMISRNNENAQERSRNYYINIDEQFVFDCNIENSESSTAYCEKRYISGEFSNYNTVEFDYATNLTINGNSFTQELHDYVDSSTYKKKDFNIEDLRNGMDKEHSFKLRNKVLWETVASKTVKIHYNFSEADLNVINQLHDKWVAEEAEKEAKAQREAEEKARKEAEEKAKKEAEERAAKEEAERKAKEEAEKKATESGDNPDQIPEDEVYTGIAACQRVAKNNYGITLKTREFSNGYVGGESYTWMFVFRGSSYNMVTCCYNWKTGYAEIRYVNI